MDPLYEQRLRDEVVYLHSLWYHGPPRPAAASATATCYSLQPSQSIHFKKVQKRRGKSGNVCSNSATHESSSSHDAVWPCPPSPPSPAAWPASSGPPPEPLSLSAEEQLKLDAKGAHHHALKTVRDFLISNNADGSDEIDSSDDDDDRQMDEDCGHEEYSFFCKMFEDTKLREYYEKNFVVGEFCCLVCGALGGKKTAKKFNGCLPLVQHSISIEKTKRRAAHRAFAQAVCKVLGWDIHHLPKIASMLSDKSCNAQGNDNVKNRENSVSFVHNVDSIKNDEAASASDAGKNFEDVDILHTLCNLKEPASDELTTSSVACAVDETENQVRPRNIATIASTSDSVPILRHHLQPSEATKFKKKKKRKGKSGKILTKNAVTESNSSHGAEWPCPSPPHLPSTSVWPTTGWVTLEKSSPKPVLSTEEQSILAARHAHKHALKLVHEFFRTNISDDSDEIDSGSDDDDDDDDELMEEDSGSKEYNFFLKVFEEDTKLRECYVKNFAEGEFSCLVCGAVGWKKSGKKFKGCLPLLQHLISITKTKKRKAHRAFRRAVCNVLGWDIDHLPTIDSMLSDKTTETQTSLTCADSNKNLENPGMVYQQNMEEPASKGFTTNSLVGLDADNNENLGIVHQEEQSASERSKINSLVGPDADNNETLGILQPMEQPASEGSKINSLVGPDADNQESLGVVHQVEQPASQRSKINYLVGPDADKDENMGILHQMEQPASEGSMIVPGAP